MARPEASRIGTRKRQSGGLGGTGIADSMEFQFNHNEEIRLEMQEYNIWTLQNKRAEMVNWVTVVVQITVPKREPMRIVGKPGDFERYGHYFILHRGEDKALHPMTAGGKVERK